MTRTLPKVGQSYPEYNLARVITRLLSRTTYSKPASAVPLSWYENVWGYFEVRLLWIQHTVCHSCRAWAGIAALLLLLSLPLILSLPSIVIGSGEPSDDDPDEPDRDQIHRRLL